MNRAVVKSACDAAGIDRSQVIGTQQVGGGCINEGLKVRTKGGDFFLKWNAEAGEDFFRVEAEGLEALAGAGAVRTPAVLARSRKSDDVSWLLLEWIHEARPDGGSWRRLGRALAELHRSPSGDGRYGWHSDNVIGSLPQPNRWTDDWGTFWAELRIRPLARGTPYAGNPYGPSSRYGRERGRRSRHAAHTRSSHGRAVAPAR